MKNHVCKTVDDCRIHADVYPAPELPAPVLVHIHGGCLMYGSRAGFRTEQVALYNNAGYTVVSIDYRLAPETKVPGIIEDPQDAFTWVRQEGAELFQADPDRIGVVGHSAGGYLALMSGICVDPKPNALVAFYGYGDIIAEWYAEPDAFYCTKPPVSEDGSGIHLNGPACTAPYDGRGTEQLYLYCRQNGLWPEVVGGRDPKEDPGFFEPYCPERNVSSDYPPTLLLHGDKDTDVPYSQSVAMDAELTRHNVAHEFITIKDGSHGFDGNMDDAQVKAAFDKVLTFLNTHLSVHPE